MKKDYKKLWKKLKTVIEDDLIVVKRCMNDLKSSNQKDDFANVIEYIGIESTYNFLLEAMDELDGKEHHNIFTFEKGKKC